MDHWRWQTRGSSSRTTWARKSGASSPGSTSRIRVLPGIQPDFNLGSTRSVSEGFLTWSEDPWALNLRLARGGDRLRRRDVRREERRPRSRSASGPTAFLGHQSSSRPSGRPGSSSWTAGPGCRSARTTASTSSRGSRSRFRRALALRGRLVGARLTATASRSPRTERRSLDARFTREGLAANLELTGPSFDGSSPGSATLTRGSTSSSRASSGRRRRGATTSARRPSSTRSTP